MRVVRYAIAAVLLAAMTGQAQAAFIITFSTDITNANTTVDSDHWYGANFSITQEDDYTIVGDFVLKKGANTVLPITFSVFSGFGATPTSVNPLGTVTVAASSITQSFQSILFNINPATLHLGVGNYSVLLSSGTGTTGALQYGLKGDSTGPTVTFNDQGGPVVPEPTSMALAGFAGIGMAVGAWRRHRQEKQQVA